MDSLSEIAPGTPVQSTDGVAGTVEALTSPSQEGETPAGVLLVRSEDGTRTYRVPATVVARIDEKQGRPAVILTISSAALKGYLADVRPVDELEHDAVAPAAEEWEPQAEGDALHIPLRAEMLDAHTEPIDLGRVHVHKGVETTEQHLRIPVVREEVIIERLAPEQYDATAPVGPDELIIPVVEEKIVFEKRSVVKEYIRIRKQRVESEEEIRGTVRREFVQVTEQPRDGQDSQSPSLFRVR